MPTGLSRVRTCRPTAPGAKIRHAPGPCIAAGARRWRWRRGAQQARAAELRCGRATARRRTNEVGVEAERARSWQELWGHYEGGGIMRRGLRGLGVAVGVGGVWGGRVCGRGKRACWLLGASEDLGHRFVCGRRLGCVYGRRLTTGSLCPSATRLRSSAALGARSLLHLCLRRLCCGCGRRLVTGSCVYLRDDPDGLSAV